MTRGYVAFIMACVNVFGTIFETGKKARNFLTKFVEKIYSNKFLHTSPYHVRHNSKINALGKALFRINVFKVLRANGMK